MPGSSKSCVQCLQVERKTTQGLLEQIHAERSGEPVDRQLLQHLMRMLTSLGVSRWWTWVIHGLQLG